MTSSLQAQLAEARMVGHQLYTILAGCNPRAAAIVAEAADAKGLTWLREQPGVDTPDTVPVEVLAARFCVSPATVRSWMLRDRIAAYTFAECERYLGARGGVA